MQVNDYPLNGVVILSVDSEGRALSVEFPPITDGEGNSLTITFAYGQVLDAVLAIAHAYGL